jgi:hypothetical protein
VKKRRFCANGFNEHRASLMEGCLEQKLWRQAFLLFDFELFIGGRSALHTHHLGSTGMYMAVGSVLDDFFIDGKAANLV